MAGRKLHQDEGETSNIPVLALERISSRSSSSSVGFGSECYYWNKIVWDQRNEDITDLDLNAAAGLCGALRNGFCLVLRDWRG